jgi:DNA-binding Xre family transcriptional regulator
MDKKKLKKQWTNFLIDNDLKNVDIAKQLGVTKQTMSKKINNGSIRYIDLANIVEKYGYSVDIHKKQK